MKLVPTKRFWWLLGVGLVLALVGAAVPGVEKLVILFDLALFSFMLFTRGLVGDVRKLEAQRSMDIVLSARALNTIEVELTNTGKIRLQGLIRDECPPDFESEDRTARFDLKPGQTAKLVYRVRPHERGTAVFPCSIVRIQCPFGLCEWQEELPNRTEVKVFPNLKAIEEFDLLNRKGTLMSQGMRQSRKRGLGSEFDSLRDYAVGDDYRRIDWKATARRGKMVVREFEAERNQPVFVVIDAGRTSLAEADGATKLDHVLDSALLLLHAAVNAGDQIGLLIYAERVLQYVPPRRGRRQMNLILDAIHNLHGRPTESDHHQAMQYLGSRWNRRALIVLFTDFEQDYQAKDLVSAISPLRYRHLWFVARVKDPELNVLSQLPLSSRKSVFQRAAFSWLQEERMKSERVIRGMFRESIEAEPGELSRKLVNAYVDAKLKAAI